ncbi:MAG: ABC-2 family transporter protein [Anaerolineae bacterium]
MTITLRRTFSRYAAIAALAPKFYLAYRGWVWMELFVRGLAMTIFFYFWHSVYAQNDSISGLNLSQTLSYVMLAQTFGQAVGADGLQTIGYLMREGMIGIELLRPVDFQMSRYAMSLMDTLIALIVALPLLLLGVLAFGVVLPTNALVWLAFLVSLVLGHAALYMFMWALGCLTFYTTEVWGLSVLVWSVFQFFSGALIPLTMLPDWLRGIANALPFGQAVFVPISILSGVTPLSDVPRLWLIQLMWLISMFFVSRVVFHFAVRKVTVQGG